MTKELMKNTFAGEEEAVAKALCGECNRSDYDEEKKTHICKIEQFEK